MVTDAAAIEEVLPCDRARRQTRETGPYHPPDLAWLCLAHPILPSSRLGTRALVRMIHTLDWAVAQEVHLGRRARGGKSTRLAFAARRSAWEERELLGAMAVGWM